MNNAEKFKKQFNLYATELWAMSEENFVIWLNSEYEEPLSPVKREIKSYVLTPPKDTTNTFDTRTVWWDECENCSTKVQPSWRYCPHCGAKLDWGHLYEEFK